MTDRIPGAPGRYQAQFADGELAGKEFTVTLRRDDDPITEGTPYNKANVLPDALAVQLCPELPDPAPKDAFAALQNQKADTGRRKSGTNITLNDAADAPLMGLRIFGHDIMDENGEVHIVGQKGSVTLNVRGKNLLDYRKAYPRQSGQTVTIDESINGLYWTGNYHFFIDVNIPAGTTFRLSCESESEDGNYIRSAYLEYTDGTEQLFGLHEAITAEKDVKRVLIKSYNTTAQNIKVWNLQLEVGTTVTEYEPYKEPQTLVVPTPDGLYGGDDICDEIDFAKGVLIRRISEQSVTPLPEDVLEAYARLRTYAPTTIITNDESANMEGCYCTSSTAVPMLHNPVNQGKFLAIDSHGAVSGQAVAAYVEHRGKPNGWESRIWSDGFLEMHKKDTEGVIVGQNGFCQSAYDLPFPVDSDCVVQVTPWGNVHIVNCTISDDISLVVTLAGQAGTPVSAIHISVAGRLKPGD